MTFTFLNLTVHAKSTDDKKACQVKSLSELVCLDFLLKRDL